MSRQHRAATLALAFRLMAPPSSLQTLLSQARALGSRFSQLLRRVCSAILAFVFLVPLAWAPPLPAPAAISSNPHIAYDNLTLPGGQVATVYDNGRAIVYPSTKNHSAFEQRQIQLVPQIGIDGRPKMVLPDRLHVAFELTKPSPTVFPFAPQRLVVVYRPGVTATQDVMELQPKTAIALRKAVARHMLTSSQIPQYTNDGTTNRALAELGVNREERLFRKISRSTLSAMAGRVHLANGRAGLDISNAYRVYVSTSSVRDAAHKLSKLASVAYASPDFLVGTMQAPAIDIPHQAVSAAAEATQRMQLRRPASISMPSSALSAALPTNYAVSSSAQSMLNTPSDDVMAAYDEIKRHFNQQPGQGEIITNVSLGDLDDASEESNPSDPCHLWASFFGPTTEVISGQRYINWPSMPLIPAYAADQSGNLSGDADVCGVDPFMSEIGLDFSMMAPLPHDMQRAGEQGNGFSDLLGIAPGAQYRLVVPASSMPSMSDLYGAFLGAAMQTPRPNVITASLGFGLDVYGFPGRYLEDDPLTESLIATIVQGYQIVVCMSANDGTREFTNASIGPSGGSAPTNQIAAGGTPTNLNDIGLSTVPSEDLDSGSIDVGATTLDDIFSNPPLYTADQTLQAQHAYPDTRFSGFTLFSSGFGSRVNVSAPGDNVIEMFHAGPNADSVALTVSGGTSASAPETAAAAAIVEQVGRLTNHPFSDPLAVRSFLVRTGSPVPNDSQTDTSINVGPQIDLRRAVETLLAQGGIHDKPSAARVAVEQRQQIGFADGLFLTNTDPANINLNGDAVFGPSSGTNVNEYMWITIAPDWEFAPGNARYSLTVSGTKNVLATTPWARLQPKTILNAAGLPLVSTSTRTVTLTYSMQGVGPRISTAFSLTFGPADATSQELLAPQVPSVVTGSTIPVSYDYSHFKYPILNPVLEVSEPGRIDTWTGQAFHPSYTVPLTTSKGTVQVPVSALQGGGVYGISITGHQPIPCWCDFAFTRVAPAGSGAARPPAPLLAANGSTPGHSLEIPYNGTFQVSYDVSNVPGATGSALEVSARGPNRLLSTRALLLNTFNNPNGTVRDNNGVDTGSPYFVPLSGVKGTVTLDSQTAHLESAMFHNVRVIPMSGSRAVGEAGDVSTITMDGVIAPDGGFPGFGFGINQHGTDGLLTSTQILLADPSAFPTPKFFFNSSLYMFDQRTNITSNISSIQGSALFFEPPFDLFAPDFGPGIYHNDLGLFGAVDLDQLTSPNWNASYRTINTVSSGSIGPVWTPPNVGFGFSGMISAALNQDNDNAAFLFQDPSGTFGVFGSNIASNSFTPLYNISGPMSGFAAPNVSGFGQDTSNNTAYAIEQDFGNLAARNPPVLVKVDLATGAIDSWSGVGCGLASNMAVDPTTHIAIVPQQNCGTGSVIAFYDLAHKTATTTVVPVSQTLGDEVQYAAVDPINHLFFVVFLWSLTPTGQDAVSDNNGMFSILVYDESGHLIKSLPEYYLITFGNTLNHMLQINPATRTLYFPASFDTELRVVKY